MRYKQTESLLNWLSSWSDRTMAPNATNRNENGLEEKTTEDSKNMTNEKHEVLFEGYYYDVTNFIDRHPGGSVIKYYTKKGEDATMAILQFHYRSKKKVAAMMATLPKRRADTAAEDLGLTPEEYKRHLAMTEDLKALQKEAEQEGLFKPVYFRNALVVLEIVSLWLVGAILVNVLPSFAPFGLLSWPLKILAAIPVGVALGRSGLLQHEGGHNSLTGRPGLDKHLQNLFFGLFMGMSGTWWTREHNRHHAMPQRVHHDFDMENLPMYAVYEDQVADVASTFRNNVFTRYQKHTIKFTPFLVWMSHCYVIHPFYMIKRGLWQEIIAIILHNYLAYNLIGLVPFLLGRYFESFYLLSSFSLNHSHLDITYNPKHWLEYATTHTMNIEHTPFNDWWLILLNYQIEHHMFPTMPQYNLRFVAKRAEALAKKYQLPYDVCSLREAYSRQFKSFKAVGKFLQEKHQEYVEKKSQ